MEMAKSKYETGWGRLKMSATMAAWGWCWEAMAVRLVDLLTCQGRKLYSTLPGYMFVLCSAVLFCRCDLPVRAYNEHIWIHQQVFAIAAADVKANGSARQGLEVTFYDRPWL